MQHECMRKRIENYHKISRDFKTFNNISKTNVKIYRFTNVQFVFKRRNEIRIQKICMI